MTALEKLLEGVEVEWKPLAQLADIGTGSHDTKDAVEEGNYVFYARGKKTLKLNSYDFEETAIITAGDGVGVGKVFHWVEGKYALHQRAYRIAPFKSVNPRYVFHYVLANFYSYIMKASVHSSVTSLRKPMFLKFPIPIPCPDNLGKSLKIQKEIVRILDTFTELTTELTTELAARKQQYSYYRGRLLSFRENEIKWKPLKEIAEYSKRRISFDKLNENNYVGVDNLLQDRLGKTISTRVPLKGNSTQYQEDDILIGNIRPYLKKIWLSDRLGGTNGDVLVIHLKDKNINPRFLYQVLADDRFFEYNMKYAKGAKMPRGNKPKIMDYPIPIPSTKEQERIVSILDKFDVLTSSITEGLPKEIELRNKQYEYYREQLLSFPKEKVPCLPTNP